LQLLLPSADAALKSENMLAQREAAFEMSAGAGLRSLAPGWNTSTTSKRFTHSSPRFL
jgi:hypothetical protein